MNPSAFPQESLLSLLRARADLSSPGPSQFEDLYIDAETAGRKGERLIHFRYFFDEDGFSQYDRRIGLSGEARLTRAGLITLVKLELTSVGVGVVWNPPTALRTTKPG